MSYNFPLGLIGQYVTVAGKALDKGEEQKDQQSMMYTCFLLLVMYANLQLKNMFRSVFVRKGVALLIPTGLDSRMLNAPSFKVYVPSILFAT